tara:strand:+ start:474 stop:650 length:177 start_codon:yes stop_codon:yes gene_type:complete
MIVDDMERISLAIVRGNWDYNQTGIMKLEPTDWTVSVLPTGNGLEADLTIQARIRRVL